MPGSYSRVADGDVMTILDWMKRLRQMENERWRYDEKTNENVPEYRLGQASIFSDRDRVTRLQVPKPDGARAFEVVGIPLKKPGFYVVELASPRLGAALLNSRTPYYVQSAALVTNLAVHFKWGRESSLVWVTALDSGAPVPKALVSIQDCSGRVFFRGPTDAQGRARVAAVLPDRERLPGCVSEYDKQIVVSARLADDLVLRHVRLERGHRALAFQPARRRLERALRRDHGVRSHAAARRRNRQHEALLSPARGQRFLVRAGRQPAEEDHDRAPGHGAEIRSAGDVGRTQYRGQHLEDPGGREERHLQSCR